jgi:hypothetical protein
MENLGKFRWQVRMQKVIIIERTAGFASKLEPITSP